MAKKELSHGRDTKGRRALGYVKVGISWLLSSSHGQDYLVSLGVSEGLRSLANIFQHGKEKKKGAGNESKYK